MGFIALILMFIGMCCWVGFLAKVGCCTKLYTNREVVVVVMKVLTPEILRAKVPILDGIFSSYRC